MKTENFYMVIGTGAVVTESELDSIEGVLELKDYKPIFNDDHCKAGTWQAEGYWRAHINNGYTLDGANIPDDQPREKIESVLNDMISGAL